MDFLDPLLYDSSSDEDDINMWEQEHLIDIRVIRANLYGT